MRQSLGQPLPILTGATQWLGRTVAAEELHGKPLLLYFWSLSCHLCKEKLPFISTCAHYYASCGLQVVGIHTPSQATDNDLEPIREVLIHFSLEHPVALDTDLQIATRFGVRYLPAFFIYDRRSICRHFQSGNSSVQWLEAHLRQVCAQP